MTNLALHEEPRTRPTYLHAQLPVVMASDAGLARFLRGLDEMASELYERVGQKEFMFDIGIGPLPVVRMLAERIGVPIDPMLDEQVQRTMARVAAATFPIRGTRESLERNLEALTGMAARVHDQGDVIADWPARIAAPTRATARTAGGAVPARSHAEFGIIGAVGDDGSAGGHTIRIEMAHAGRATAAAVHGVVRRELPCNVRYEFDPPLPQERSGTP